MDLAFRHDIYHTLDKENSVIDNYELVLDGQVSCMIVIVTCEKRNFDFEISSNMIGILLLRVFVSNC